MKQLYISPRFLINYILLFMNFNKTLCLEISLLLSPQIIQLVSCKIQNYQIRPMVTKVKIRWWRTVKIK